MVGREPVSYPPSGGGGFTLVEVMVALAILSLIMLATVTALRTFANTQQAVERMTGRVDEVRTVSSFLRDQFAAAVVGQNSSGLTLGGGVEEGAYFKGDSDSMEWKATVKFGESYGGSHLVRVERHDSELLLLWQDVPSNTVDVDWKGAQSRRLVGGVEAFDIAYRLDYSEPWKQKVEMGDTPVLVRVRLQSQGRFWPDLVMEVSR